MKSQRTSELAVLLTCPCRYRDYSPKRGDSSHQRIVYDDKAAAASVMPRVNRLTEHDAGLFVQGDAAVSALLPAARQNYKGSCAMIQNRGGLLGRVGVVAEAAEAW